MKIIVGSTNPAKIQAVKAAFNQVFTNVDLEIKGVKAESGVAEQPMTEQETLTGAHNRIKSAQALVPDADYYVSIEGGVEVKEEKLMLFGWAVVEQAGKTGQGRSATYEAPPFFYEMIVGQGNDLGYATDVLLNEVNSGQTSGTVGLLSGGVIDRSEFYRHALVCALFRFINPDLYELDLIP